MRQKALALSDPGKLNFNFSHPPLLVAGMALMYYGLRESGKDIDFILHPEDHKNLALKLKDQATVLDGSHTSGYKEKPELVDLYGDHGIIIYNFEIWDKIFQFNYQGLISGAITEDKFLVIGLDMLLVLCALRGLKDERYMKDAKLIAQEIMNIKYDSFDNNLDKQYWEKLLS